MQQRKMSGDMNGHSKCFLLPTRFIFHSHPTFNLLIDLGYVMLYAPLIPYVFLCAGTSISPWSEVPKIKMVSNIMCLMLDVSLMLYII
jgi:hypothetical protein